MKTTILKGTDITTTRLGFGCAQIMRIGSARERNRLLETAFDSGIRHFDVARMYGLGAAEGELGKFARGRRDQLVLATKFGIDVNTSVKRAAFMQSAARRVLGTFPALRRFVRRGGGALVQPHDFSVARAQSSLETSLRELGTDYIDILFLHEPALQDEITPEVIAYLDQARSTGLIRSYGLSGNYHDVHALSERFPMLGAVVQFPNDALTRVLHQADWSARQAILTYSPFSNALPAISSRLMSDQASLQKWTAQLGVDCSSVEKLAAPLLQYCLHANSEGCVVFSSTKARRIVRLAATADENIPVTFEPETLERLSDELCSRTLNKTVTA
jgi:D-threo-aldose 1-dehydrogenase